MANEGKREWFIKLINSRTKRWVNDDTGAYQVYDPNDVTRVQINNAAGADVSQATPQVAGDYTSATMTDGTLRFWTNRSVSVVDVSILTAGGRAYFLDGIDSSQHRVDVDEQQTNYVLTIGIEDNASSSNVRKLGFALKKGMVLNDVIVHVTAAFIGAEPGSARYDLGRSGDANGFFNGMTFSTTGFKSITPRSTTGLIVLLQQGGADLISYATGATSTMTVDAYFTRVPFIPASGTALSNLTAQREQTLTGTSAAIMTGKAYIYYLYTLLPSVQTVV